MHAPLIFLSVLTVLAVMPPVASAQTQAFCALRDPVRNIRDLAPRMSGYTSIVRRIGKTHRLAIDRALPFTLHFDELGQHTLYVVQEDGRPAGLVHVRSEAHTWGLVEVAWLLDFDLRIRDFRFQKCRDRGRLQIEARAFRARLNGWGTDQLLAALVPGSKARLALDIPAGHEALADLVLRNGAKTIAATEAVWKEDVALLKAYQAARTAFGVHVVPMVVARPYDEAAQVRLQEGGLGDPGDIDREKVRLFRILDGQGAGLGWVVETPWTAGQGSARVWWVLTLDGLVLSAADAALPTHDPLARAFAGFVGRTVASHEDCLTASDLAAYEVILLCRMRGPGG